MRLKTLKDFDCDCEEFCDTSEMIDSLRESAIECIKGSPATEHPLYKMWMEFFGLSEEDLL